jgi:hypothetical protein
MKKNIIIFFLFTYLFSATQLNELFKINLLIEHYIEHKNKDKNLSLLGFIYMHYLGDNTKDDDYDKDMKLPFKAIDTHSYNLANFCTPIPAFQFPKGIALQLFQIPLYEYNFSFVSNFHSTIWQPPKSC